MIWVELVKLVRRPRSWVSILLLCALPTLVAVFVAVTHVAPPPGQGPALLSAVLSSGALFPAAALAIVLPVFLPVAVAVVAGDSIAGEASSGTLRYLLARPVGRTRLLVAKLVALVVYMLAAVALVTGTAYLTGIMLFGAQPVAATPSGLAAGATTLSGTAMTPTDIALRTLGAVSFIVVSMLGVGAIALFLSTVTDSALGAALGALAALVASEVLVTLNAAAAVDPYLPPATGSPGSTSSASRSSGGTSSAVSPCRASTSWCSSGRPGRTSPARTSPADPAASHHARQSDAVGWRTGPGPIACSTIAVTTGLTGSWE